MGLTWQSSRHRLALFQWYLFFSDYGVETFHKIHLWFCFSVKSLDEGTELGLATLFLLHRLFTTPSKILILNKRDINFLLLTFWMLWFDSSIVKAAFFVLPGHLVGSELIFSVVKSAWLFQPLLHQCIVIKQIRLRSSSMLSGKQAKLTFNHLLFYL